MFVIVDIMVYDMCDNISTSNYLDCFDVDEPAAKKLQHKNQNCI